MPIAWNESMSVHVKEIDAQHQLFVRILNEMYSGVTDPKLKCVLGHVLDEIVNYAGYHFATEEKYFDLFNYEFADEHKQEHRKMEKRLQNIYEQHKTEDVGVVGELLYFMEDWLNNHIEIHDKKYTNCFNQHGLY
jgi:hemerythrin